MFLSHKSQRETRVGNMDHSSSLHWVSSQAGSFRLLHSVRASIAPRTPCSNVEAPLDLTCVSDQERASGFEIITLLDGAAL